MRRKATIVARIALTCTAVIAAMPGSCFAQSAADQIKSTHDEWTRCLKDAYRLYARKTPSQNYAADMTLQACSMYEERLWGLSSETGVTRDAFEKLKAATKKAIMSGK